MKVKEGFKVKVNYKGTFDDDTVFDSSQGREPLEFVTGQGLVIKGFDDALIGMEIGEKKKFSIEPKEAYGEVIKELVQDVPIDAFGPDFKAEVGATLGIRAPTGQVLPAKIVSATKEKVKLDLNHPLAGKKLNFEIELVDAKKLTEAEKKEMEKQAHSHSCQDCGDEKHEHSCGGGCC